MDEAARSQRNAQIGGLAQQSLAQVQADINEQARLESQRLQPSLQLPDMLALQQAPMQEQQGSPGWLGNLIKPFQILQENIIEPGAGVLTEAVQRLIPGDQEIERKVREFQAQGVGPIESRRRAFVESDLPSTEVSLPFEIPLPFGKSLQTFDVGVKGAIELAADPLNLLFGIGVPLKGAGAAGRVLQKGLIPKAVGALRGGAKVVPANIPPGFEIRGKIRPTISPEQLKQAADEAVIATREAPTSSAEVASRVVRDQAQPKLPGFARRMIPAANIFRKLRNSKVADADGLPKVVYHGSQNIFEQFDPGRTNPDALFGPGAYFTENPDVASGYARTTRASLRQERQEILEYNIRPALEAKSGSALINISLRQDAVTKEFTLVVGSAGWGDRLESLGFKPSLDPAGKVRPGEYTIPPSFLEKAEKGQNVTPVFLRIRNPLDMDAPLDPKLKSALDDLPESLQDDAEDLLNQRLDEVTTNSEGHLFLAAAIRSRAEANETLVELGFDGITHIGGARTGTAPHRVWIALSEDRIISPKDFLDDADWAAYDKLDIPAQVEAMGKMQFSDKLKTFLKAADLESRGPRQPDWVDNLGNRLETMPDLFYTRGLSTSIKGGGGKKRNETYRQFLVGLIESSRASEEKRLGEAAVTTTMPSFENQIFGALENQRIPPKAVGPEQFVPPPPLPPKEVPAMQFMLPGFRSKQGDLLESRMQNLIDEGADPNLFHENVAKVLDQQASDAGLPTGFDPPEIAAHFGPDANDASGWMADMITKPPAIAKGGLTVIPGEKPGTAAVRSFDGAITARATEIKVEYNAGQQLLRKLGIGKWNGKKMVMGREAGEGLLRALHGQGPVPEGLEEVYSDLVRLRDIEQAKTLAKDPGLAKNWLGDEATPYFSRVWKDTRHPQKTSRTALAAKPGFAESRVEKTFVEMLEDGYEPLSWNPYDILTLRNLSGEEYRQGALLLDRLKMFGQALPKEHLDDNIHKGWRVPRDLGGAFDGKVYSDQFGKRRKSPQLYVPANVANSLETMFGKGGLKLPIERFDPLALIRKFGSTAKRAKLFGSLFQHIDFGTRALGIAFSPTGLKRGLPFKFPSLAAQLANVSLRSAPRKKLTAKILSDTPIFPGSRISNRMIAEQGWQIGGDSSLLRRSVKDSLEASILDAPAGMISKAAERVSNIAKFMEDGLFDGVYRETQAWALQNFIVPKLRKIHPVGTWTDEQIAASAAAEVNKMFSTLGEWQSVLNHPGTRDFSRMMLFSANESESWIRAGVSTMKGENKRLWQEYGLGMMTYMGLVSNLIQLHATGDTLPTEAYSPLQLNSPYSSFGGLAYNSKFLSPQISLPGRGEAPLYLDVMGQADTFLRWILDPPGALTARFNVLPRAATNQIRGEDFFGRPIEGLKDRTIQALDDLVVPIGPGFASDIIREQVPPDMQQFIPEREARLGTLGTLIQATGLNLRAMSTPDLFDRAASVSGLTMADGTPVTLWSQLEPGQKRALQVTEPLSGEIGRRNATSIERQATGAEAREAERVLTVARFTKEQHISNSFTSGDYDGRTARNAFDEAQRETIDRRTQLNKDYKRFQEEKIAPDDGTNDLALFQFYQAHNDATDNGGVYDPDKAIRILADHDREWTQEQRSFVERNTGLTEHKGVLPELKSGRKKFGSYWRVHRMVLNNDPDAIDRYEAFVGVFGESRQEVLAARPEFAEVASVIKATRERMRMLSPELDAFLFRWGYTQKLVSPSNEGREFELAPWLSTRKQTAVGQAIG